MTRNDLVRHVMKTTNLIKKKAGEAVDETFLGIMSALADGDFVQIKGFGIFKIRENAARVGRNPLTGEQINIPPKNKIKFIPSKRFKEEIAQPTK